MLLVLCQKQQMELEIEDFVKSVNKGNSCGKNIFTLNFICT